MKKTLLFAVIAGALALAGCAKDTELYNKVDRLDERVSKLEEQVKELNEQTVPGIRTLVAAIQGNVYATSVVDNGDGYTITFSNGTVATIKNGTDGKDGKDGDKGDKGDTPVISAAEFEGEFYWTVNGEFLTDADGNKIPVHKALPTFKIIDGKWNVSYDNGTTWEVVPQMGESEAIPISIVDGEDTVTFYIGDESYVIKKEVAFYLVFDQRTDLGVIEGQTSSFPYTIKGVAEGDEVEVDVLNVIGTWDAEVVATDNQSGNVKVTNNGGDAKVFVYASNGKGKTDIKSLVFEGGELTASLNATSVSYEGGEVELTITTNVNYEVQIDKEATWLTVAPETKATHTDNITLVAEANTTSSARTATVTVVGDGVNKEFEVIQEAAPKPEYSIDITIENITSDSVDATFTPNDNTVHYIAVVESPGWVEQFDTPEELAQADLDYYIDLYSDLYDVYGFDSLEDLILNGICNTGVYSDTFDELNPNSKYYAYAYCIDEELNIVSTVFIKYFTTEDVSGSGKYADYLGTWKMGSEVIEITEKENGKTYNVSGIKNMAEYGVSAVEGEFENGLFVLKAQATGCIWNNTNYGDCDLYFTGQFTANGKTYPGAPTNGSLGDVLITGDYDAANSKIVVTPGKYASYPFFSLNIRWIIKEGANAGLGNTFTGTTITDMTKYEDNVPAELIGKWVCESATDYWGESTYTNWTMDITKTRSGIVIKHFDAGIDEIIEANNISLETETPATWDSATKTLVVADNTETGLQAGNGSIGWRGVDEDDYYCDIIFNVDLAAGKMELANVLMGAFDTTGAYSLFAAPLVFTKTSGTPSSMSVTGSGNTAKKVYVGNIEETRIGTEKFFGFNKRAGMKK